MKINELLWDFDCVSLYPSAMWGKNSIYPKIETGYAFEKHMIDELVEKYIIQSFIRGPAILKIKNYNPRNLIVHYLPIKEREHKSEIYRI